MRYFLVVLIILPILFCAPCSDAESILGGLENINEGLNNLNTSILDSLDGNNAQAQIARYRKLEAARVHEMAEVTGVDPDVIRKMRQEGATWEQIAAHYNINLENLPAPQIQ